MIRKNGYDGYRITMLLSSSPISVRLDIRPKWSDIKSFEASIIGQERVNGAFMYMILIDDN